MLLEAKLMFGFYLSTAVYLSLEWMRTLTVSSLPMVTISYHCTPNPTNFILDDDGDLVTQGLELYDSEMYICTSRDFTGSRIIDLTVTGKNNSDYCETQIHTHIYMYV